MRRRPGAQDSRTRQAVLELCFAPLRQAALSPRYHVLMVHGEVVYATLIGASASAVDGEEWDRLGVVAAVVDVAVKRAFGRRGARHADNSAARQVQVIDL